MEINNYKLLNFKEESTSLYNKRLEAFAISNRLPRPSNFAYVADQIVKQELINRFKYFVPPTI
ncbi:hypothetical protein GCM10028805_21280 [Spirosoma harenae]